MKSVLVEAKNALLIIIGIFLAAFGLKGFLLSSRFIDGGVTGISMLIAELSPLSLPLLIAVINLPFVLIAYRHIGPKFAIKSALGILGLSLCLGFVQFPDVTPDKLLTAVFGGLFIGAGIGLAIRGGSVLDGTEIAALLISRRSYLVNISDVILILNIFVFSTAAIFLSVESAMYSILTYVAATKSIDFLLHGFEEYTALTIISPKGPEIREAITKELQRGVTVIRGSGGMGSSGEVDDDREILYCVVTRIEIGAVKATISGIDPQAFITTHAISDVDGGLLKRQILH